MKKDPVLERSQEINSWIEINMEHLNHNIKLIGKKVGACVNLMPVVKADAYGHGSVHISKELQKNPNVIGLAVSSVLEGIELRQAGVSIPLFILEDSLPGQEPLIIDYNLTPLIANFSMAKELAIIAEKKQKKVQVQIRISIENSNMGISTTDLPDFINQIKEIKWLDLQGFFTHLYAAYNQNDKLVSHQLSEFNYALSIAQKMNLVLPLIHAASSPAILRYPDAYYNTVRPGTILYGLSSFDNQEDIGLKPVMQLKSKVAKVKSINAGGSITAGYNKQSNCNINMRIATVPLGYSDALFLLKMKGGEVIINGGKAPIVGIPFMSHFLVDISLLPDTYPGDEVVIFGIQGNRVIRVEDIAQKAGIGTTNCESICFLSSRVPRYIS